MAETCSPMTADEIIDETLEYYTGHPERFARNTALSESGDDPTLPQYKCSYFTKDGRMCAVGRCLDKEAALKHIGAKCLRQSHPVTEMVLHSKSALDLSLQPKYQGHPLEFWADLQNLHDSRRFWNSEAQLTASGRARVHSLRESYGHA